MTIRFWRGLWGDRRGNVVVIFAICLFPMMLAVGAVIDTARLDASGQRLKAATDIAALIGVRALVDGDQTEPEIIAMTELGFAEAMTTHHSDATCGVVSVEVSSTDMTVSVTGTCSLPTVFGATVIDSGALSTKRTSTAKSNTLPKIDLALMLDVSMSMEGQRLADLKTAANTLVTGLLDGQVTGDTRVRIALAPFSRAVNAGVYGNRALGKSDINDDDGDGDKVCVSRRRNTTEDFTDAAPMSGQHVGDRVGVHCESGIVVPLTNNTSKLTSAINALTADDVDGTAGHLGIAWTWYLLSPHWNQVWPPASSPSAYDADNAMKVAVIMTDGVFQKAHDPGGSPAASAVYARELCTKLLAQGVTVYVVGFNVPIETNPGLGRSYSEWLTTYGAQNLLPYCAGDTSRYQNVTDGAALISAYAEIANALTYQPIALIE